MGAQAWVSPYRITKVDGPPLSNTTTITSLLQAQDKIVIPGGLFQVGSGLRIHLLGRISTVVTTPGTWTITIRYGSSAIATSQAFALSTTAQTNDSFIADINMTCRAEGSSGNFMFDGQCTSQVFTNAISTVMFGPNTAPVVGGNADLSVNGFLDIMGTWSVASSSNSFTLHQCQVEFLN